MEPMTSVVGAGQAQPLYQLFVLVAMDFQIAGGRAAVVGVLVSLPAMIGVSARAPSPATAMTLPQYAQKLLC